MLKYEAFVYGSLEEGTYEICVIRKDYELGHKSFGWDGLKKIILFSDIQEPVLEEEEEEFMMFCANALCDSLNNSKYGKEIK